MFEFSSIILFNMNIKVFTKIEFQMERTWESIWFLVKMFIDKVQVRLRFYTQFQTHKYFSILLTTKPESQGKNWFCLRKGLTEIQDKSYTWWFWPQPLQPAHYNSSQLCFVSLGRNQLSNLKRDIVHLILHTNYISNESFWDPISFTKFK